ncbi:hypothetical protein LOTGIDRAFT_165436 [Lottia gigantea]|uniref:CIDE-N domain-containing protein n=1 Tax=Lottia gigantea TaxID=225164 RepID=V3ZW89_LOTGI|nr:hypothetical protein LOTGIDRAFT_165436 [Lottia gigantea]ESO88652.1 hypothetical protein LOTGIDRAFT_165436 [Lottia gigantea]
MPLYKISNENRTCRKLVVAGNLTELLDKGIKKLEIENGLECYAVLENDGTPIEESEELIALTKDDTIMLLEKGKTWQKLENATSPVTEMEPDDLTPPVSHETTGCSSSDESYAWIVSNPLPAFSSIITQNKEKIEQIWRPLVNETAIFYYNKFPEIGQSSQYQAISKKVLRDFLCIGLPGGAHPWTTFSKSVAQKIRHIRHNSKVKSLDSTDASSNKKPRKSSEFAQIGPIEESTEKDEEKHKIELLNEWKKVNPDKKHIKLLINTTSNLFNTILKTNPGGQIQPILNVFPCFTDIEFIIYKLSLKLGIPKIERISERLNKLLAAIEKIMKRSAVEDDPWRFFHAIRFIEDEIKNGKSESLIRVTTEYNENEIEKHLQTKENQPLFLQIFTSSDKIEGISRPIAHSTYD